jgi:hypothetical protein
MTASPTARADGEPRPWRDIHMLCHPSMPTASSRMTVSNSSCPMPDAAAKCSPQRRHEPGADDAAGDAAGNPAAAARRSAARRQHNADDQSRLENLAKDDNGGAEHRRAPAYFAMI